VNTFFDIVFVLYLREATISQYFYSPILERTIMYCKIRLKKNSVCGFKRKVGVASGAVTSAR